MIHDLILGARQTDIGWPDLVSAAAAAGVFMLPFQVASVTPGNGNAKTELCYAAVNRTVPPEGSRTE